MVASCYGNHEFTHLSHKEDSPSDGNKGLSLVTEMYCSQNKLANSYFPHLEPGDNCGCWLVGLSGDSVW